MPYSVPSPSLYLAKLTCFPFLTGVDWVQQNVMGQGDQSNESAIEQAKDEQISDFIRGQYKGKTGKEFPVADKN